jgi:septal ring factor EnvC (AmiA/AmiB activator)
MTKRVQGERIRETLGAWRRALRELRLAERTLADVQQGAPDADARAALKRAMEAEAEAAEHHRAVQSRTYQSYIDREQETERSLPSLGDPTGSLLSLGDPTGSLPDPAED